MTPRFARLALLGACWLAAGCAFQAVAGPDDGEFLPEVAQIELPPPGRVAGVPQDRIVGVQAGIQPAPIWSTIVFSEKARTLLETQSQGLDVRVDVFFREGPVVWTQVVHVATLAFWPHVRELTFHARARLTDPDGQVLEGRGRAVAERWSSLLFCLYPGAWGGLDTKRTEDAPVLEALRLATHRAVIDLLETRTPAVLPRSAEPGDAVIREPTLPGSPGPAQPAACPECSREVQPSWVACPYCGERLRSN